MYHSKHVDIQFVIHNTNWQRLNVMKMYYNQVPDLICHIGHRMMIIHVISISKNVLVHK